MTLDLTSDEIGIIVSALQEQQPRKQTHGATTAAQSIGILIRKLQGIPVPGEPPKDARQGIDADARYDAGNS
jgi:hypothetical protein